MQVCRLIKMPSLTDECTSNPCQNSGACTNIINGFTCACLAGYTGARCAADIGKCIHPPHDDVTD